MKKQRARKKERRFTFDVLPHALRDLLDPVQRVVEVKEHGLDRRAVWGGERAGRHFVCLFFFLVSDREVGGEKQCF